MAGAGPAGHLQAWCERQAKVRQLAAAAAAAAAAAECVLAATFAAIYQPYIDPM